jgi:hypothetical protein
LRRRGQAIGVTFSEAVYDIEFATFGIVELV